MKVVLLLVLSSVVCNARWIYMPDAENIGQGDSQTSSSKDTNNIVGKTDACVPCSCKYRNRKRSKRYSTCRIVTPSSPCTGYCVKCKRDGTTPMPGRYSKHVAECKKYTAALQTASPEFGIIFDAGGSGTRMYIYEYDSDGRPSLTKYVECEDKGLAHFLNVRSLEKPLEECLRVASQNITGAAASRSQIYLGATAGMRVLSLANPSHRAAIMAKVSEILSNRKFPVKKIEMMPGKKEGSYSWTTVNSLLKKEPTSGMIEMGSTSLQIAFVPEYKVKGHKGFFDKVTLNGKSHAVYAHSYLCMGVVEIQKRYWAQIIAKYIDVKNCVDDPCAFKGSKKVVDAKDVFQGPCVIGDYAKRVLGSYESYAKKVTKTVTIHGTGDYARCYDEVKSLFKNNVYQPPVHGPFYTVGSAIYYAALFAGVTGESDEKEFEEATKKLCQTTYKEVSQRFNSKEYGPMRCFLDVFMVHVLKDILKYDGAITFAKKIKDNKLEWTYGAAVQLKRRHG